MFTKILCIVNQLLSKGALVVFYETIEAFRSKAIHIRRPVAKLAIVIKKGSRTATAWVANYIVAVAAHVSGARIGCLKVEARSLK